MKIYLLSLPRSQTRRKFMTEQFEKYNIDNFEIVDGVAADSVTNLADVYDDQAFRSNQKRPAVLGEIGCYLAHGRVLEKIAKFNKPGIVLEDDCMINENFKNFLDSQLPQDFDMIFLNRPDPAPRFFDKESDQLLIPLKPEDMSQSTWLALSYVISPGHAELILKDYLPMKNVSDCWERRYTRKYFTVSAVCCCKNQKFQSEIENRDISSPCFGQVEI